MNYQEKCAKWALEMQALMNTKAFEAMCGDMYFPNKYERELFVIMANYCEDQSEKLYNRLTERPLPVEDVKHQMDAFEHVVVPTISGLRNFKPLD